MSSTRMATTRDILLLKLDFHWSKTGRVVALTSLLLAVSTKHKPNRYVEQDSGLYTFNDIASNGRYTFSDIGSNALYEIPRKDKNLMIFNLYFCIRDCFSVQFCIVKCVWLGFLLNKQSSCCCKNVNKWIQYFNDGYWNYS